MGTATGLEVVPWYPDHLSTLTPTYLFVLVRGEYRRASSISELSDNLTVTQQNLTVTKPRY